MMRLRWTRPALAHVREIGEHIRQDNPRAAHRVVLTIRERVMILAEHPGVGRPGRVEGTRELVIPRLPYIAVYRLHGDTVEVIAVVHTARRWPEQFSSTTPSE